MTNTGGFDDQWYGSFLGNRAPRAERSAAVEPPEDDTPEPGKSVWPDKPDFRALYPAPDAACSREQFLKDVAGHQMEVLRDDGMYRHLKFRRPDQGAYWFQLTTWPGFLVITGDMGDFVFTRVNDMFTFFRPDDWEKAKSELYINPGYWGEKCVARGRDGLDKFDPATFKARIADWCADDDDLTKEQWEQIVGEVIRCADDGHVQAVQAALDFQMEVEPDRGPGHRAKYRQYFQDFWEVDCTEWQYHYLWCLYAIVWGIQQYDTTMAAKTTYAQAEVVGFECNPGEGCRAVTKQECQ